MGEVCPYVGFWQGSEGFFIDGGGVRVVWFVSGRDRRFYCDDELFRENSWNGLKSRFLLLHEAESILNPLFCRLRHLQNRCLSLLDDRDTITHGVSHIYTVPGRKTADTMR